MCTETGLRWCSTLSAAAFFFGVILEDTTVYSTETKNVYRLLLMFLPFWKFVQEVLNFMRWAPFDVEKLTIPAHPGVLVKKEIRIGPFDQKYLFFEKK